MSRNINVDMAGRHVCMSDIMYIRSDIKYIQIFFGRIECPVEVRFGRIKSKRSDIIRYPTVILSPDVYADRHDVL